MKNNERNSKVKKKYDTTRHDTHTYTRWNYTPLSIIIKQCVKNIQNIHTTFIVKLCTIHIITSTDTITENAYICTETKVIKFEMILLLLLIRFFFFSVCLVRLHTKKKVFFFFIVFVIHIMYLDILRCKCFKWLYIYIYTVAIAMADYINISGCCRGLLPPFASGAAATFTVAIASIHVMYWVYIV